MLDVTQTAREGSRNNIRKRGVHDLESYSGRVLAELELSGAPDMIMLNARSGHLYAAIGDLGVIDIIDTAARRRLETLETERGAVYVEKG